MKRIISVLALTALMVAVLAASALPAFAKPKAGNKGCNGLVNAITKQIEHRGAASEKLLAQAAAHGCQLPTTPPTTTPPSTTT